MKSKKKKVTRRASLQHSTSRRLPHSETTQFLSKTEITCTSESLADIEAFIATAPNAKTVGRIQESFEMNIGIVGSRDEFHDDLPVWIEALVTSFEDHYVVVSGGAKGVDSWAVECAESQVFAICTSVTRRSILLATVSWCSAITVEFLANSVIDSERNLYLSSSLFCCSHRVIIH